MQTRTDNSYTAGLSRLLFQSMLCLCLAVLPGFSAIPSYVPLVVNADRPFKTADTAWRDAVEYYLRTGRYRLITDSPLTRAPWQERDIYPNTTVTRIIPGDKLTVLMPKVRELLENDLAKECRVRFSPCYNIYAGLNPHDAGEPEYNYSIRYVFEYNAAMLNLLIANEGLCLPYINSPELYSSETSPADTKVTVLRREDARGATLPEQAVADQALRKVINSEISLMDNSLIFSFIHEDIIPARTILFRGYMYSKHDEWGMFIPGVDDNATLPDTALSTIDAMLESLDHQSEKITGVFVRRVPHWSPAECCTSVSGNEYSEFYFFGNDKQGAILLVDSGYLAVHNVTVLNSLFRENGDDIVLPYPGKEKDTDLNPPQSSG